MKVKISLIAVCLLAGAVYTLSLLFAESLYTRRGSYAYWICISHHIREIPEIGHVRDVTFYSSAGDGPKPPESAVTYTTDASRSTVLSRLAQHFRQHGIAIDLNALNPSIQLDRESILRVSVRPAADGRTEVMVSETF